MKSLTKKQVRANQWRKQFASRSGRSFIEVMQANIGLHSTDYWTPYLSVWARVGDFDAANVYQALNSGRSLARLNAFRHALHLVHADDFTLVTSAVGPKLFRDLRRGPGLRMFDDREIESMLDRLVMTLEGRNLNMRGLKEGLPAVTADFRSLLLLGMARGLVVRARTAHARSTACTYALRREWLSDTRTPPMDEKEAVRLVFLRYVHAFGPISVDDFAWWLPTTKTNTKDLLSQCKDEVVECSVEGTTKYMTSQDLEVATSLEEPSEPRVVLLPYEDHLPKAFRDRSWYLDEDIRPKILPHSAQAYWPEGAKPKRAMPDTGGGGVNQSGEIRPSIWIDGRIVGRWELDESTERPKVFYTLFERVPDAVRQLVSDKAVGLEDFVNRRLVPIST